MKKVLFYITLVIISILTIPYVVLATIAWIYIEITRIIAVPLSRCVGGAAPLPKWFVHFSDWVEYLTGKSL